MDSQTAASVRTDGRRLRVGIDAHSLSGLPQGIRTWTDRMIRQPRLYRDFDLIVYADLGSTKVREIRDEVGPLSGLQWRHVHCESAVTRQLAVWPILAKRDKLDYLITHYFASPLLPKRSIVVVHDVLFESHPHLFSRSVRLRNKVLVRFSVARAKLIVTVSQYSRQAIEATYSRRGLPAVVVRNGAENALTATAKTHSATAPRLLMVGRLEKRKNHLLALQAIERTRNRNVVLHIAGENDGLDPAQFRDLAAHPQVVYHGSVTQNELNELYDKASALLFLSEAEGWGIPVIEALARGLPVIASDATAIPEAGRDFCRYLDVGSPAAPDILAEMIDATIVDPPSLEFDRLASYLNELRWEKSAALLADTIIGLSAQELRTSEGRL